MFCDIVNKRNEVKGSNLTGSFEHRYSIKRVHSARHVAFGGPSIIIISIAIKVTI